MRVLAILALALPALLAAVPSVATEPVPPQCAEHRYTTDPEITFNSGCGLTVKWKAMSCPISGSWKTYSVGNTHVILYTCDPPA